MESTVVNLAESPVELETQRIRGLLEKGHFESALIACDGLASVVPENRDVLYMMAVSFRYLKRLPEALNTLEKLQRLHPSYSRLFQERGHCYVSMRDASRAIETFLVAVNLNPALPASWGTLQTLFRITGQAANEKTAAAHVATLNKLPIEIVTATTLFSDGDLALAERVVRDYLLKNGNHVEAMRLLARIGLAQDAPDDAEQLLEAVLVLAPDYQAARYDYARALLQRHKHLQAVQELENLLRVEPNNRMYKTTFATAKVGLGEHERALNIYRELLVDAPQAADIHLSIAHSLKTMGRPKEAVDAYHAAMLARPSYGDAYWSLANLKTYRFSNDEIERMRSQVAADILQSEDRYHLCFALGKALEDRADFAESYQYYERGNALKKSEIYYRPEPIERNARLQIEVCTRQFFDNRHAVGFASNAPIFIVGLPRSGSTLIEQILASHSEVEGTMELADIARLVQGLQGREVNAANPRYPIIMTDMLADEFFQIGKKYINDTRIYRTNKPFFVDKMPNNFRHIGLIHLMLPNAKIIDARREAMACCFSNFKQLFASGQEFTYSIDDIARYYGSYLELMEHWNSVLPGKILRVQHEDLVDDLEGNVRRLLEFCDLEFEPACLEFYKTERSIRTASSEQVRKPISREGIDQWRNFEPWLGPLKVALNR